MSYSLLERILMLLDGRMETPKALGLFHVVSVLLVIAASLLAVRYRSVFTDKIIPYIILSVGIVMVVLEI